MRDEMVFRAPAKAKRTAATRNPPAKQKVPKPAPEAEANDFVQRGNRVCYMMAPMQLASRFHTKLGLEDLVQFDKIPKPVEMEYTPAKQQADSTSEEPDRFLPIWITYKEMADIEERDFITSDSANLPTFLPRMTRSDTRAGDTRSGEKSKDGEPATSETTNVHVPFRKGGGYVIHVVKSMMYNGIFKNLFWVTGNNFADTQFLMSPYYVQLFRKSVPSKSTDRDPLQWSWIDQTIKYKHNVGWLPFKDFIDMHVKKLHHGDHLELIGGLLGMWKLDLTIENNKNKKRHQNWKQSEKGHVFGFYKETDIYSWFDTAEDKAEYTPKHGKNGHIDEILLFYKNKQHPSTVNLPTAPT